MCFSFDAGGTAFGAGVACVDVGTVAGGGVLLVGCVDGTVVAGGCVTVFGGGCTGLGVGCADDGTVFGGVGMSVGGVGVGVTFGGGVGVGITFGGIFVRGGGVGMTFGGTTLGALGGCADDILVGGVGECSITGATFSGCVFGGDCILAGSLCVPVVFG